MLRTPLLFLTFNRPDVTKITFNVLRLVKPKYLYLASDGPREDRLDDFKNCEQVRRIVRNVDWDCEVKTLFRDKNLGCKYGVSTAIDWFFENVDEGIILEDDCLPEQSFFTYCEELLDKYRNDERVMHISGDNFQNGIKRGTASYYFSKYVHVWGWATWKRAWKHYDVTMKSFPNFMDQGHIKNLFINEDEQNFWLSNFKAVFENKIDTWDFQWVYTVMSNNGLSTTPNENLVSNIGFQVDATHTKITNPLMDSLPTQSLKHIHHPEFIVANVMADLYSYKKIINPSKKMSLVSNLKNSLGRFTK